MQRGLWNELKCQKLSTFVSSNVTLAATNTNVSLPGWILDYGLLSIRIDNDLQIGKNWDNDWIPKTTSICRMTYTLNRGVVPRGPNFIYQDGDGMTTFPSFLKTYKEMKGKRRQREVDDISEEENDERITNHIDDDNPPNTTRRRHRSPELDGRLTWEGVFARAKVDGECSKGVFGGPCVLYQSDLPSHGTAVVLSPLDNFLDTTYLTSASMHEQKWRRHQSSFENSTNQPQRHHRRNQRELLWGASTKASYDFIPGNYQHSFVAVVGYDGVTDTMHQWGRYLTQVHHRGKRKSRGESTKVSDITLQKLGYQTDNGGQYCYCENDCDEKLIEVIKNLKEVQNIPVRYLSYQNTWWPSTWSAPWCVTDWSTANETKVPMGVANFTNHLQRMPLQLYAPYFCNNTVYANDFRHGMVSSDRSLPRKYRRVTPVFLCIFCDFAD